MSHVLRRNRDFRRFWSGHTASVVGAEVTAVSLPLISTVTLDAGAAGVSAVATAAFLPSVLLPLLAGHWLDGRRRRGVMVAADVVRAVALVAVPVAYVLDALSVPLLAAVAFVVGVASTFFDIGSFAYVPTLVEERDLGQANQAHQGSATAARVTGPGLAGLLVQLLGPALAVAATVLGYLLSAFGIGAASRPEPLPARPREKAGLFSGLGIVLRNPYLRALTAAAAMYNAASQIIGVNMVVYAINARGVDPGLYGVAFIAVGVGGFLGTMLALRWSRRFGFGRAYALGLVFSCGAPLLMPLLPWHGNAFAAGLGGIEFLSGIGLGVTNVLSVTLRQTVLPRESLARSNGAYRLITYGVLPLGAFLGGVVGESAGLHWGVTAGAVLAAASGLPMALGHTRRLREAADARPDAPAAPELAGAR